MFGPVLASLIGFAIGFVGSIPIAGPVSATIIKLGIENRFDYGKGIALGAGFAEAVYAGLAFWGFGAGLVGFLQEYENAFRGLGSVVLIVVGVDIYPIPRPFYLFCPPSSPF